MTFYYFDIRLSSVILSFEVPCLKEVKNKLKYFPVFPPHGDIFHCKAISKLICAICGWTAYLGRGGVLRSKWSNWRANRGGRAKGKQCNVHLINCQGMATSLWAYLMKMLPNCGDEKGREETMHQTAKGQNGKRGGDFDGGAWVILT